MIRLCLAAMYNSLQLQLLSAIDIDEYMHGSRFKPPCQSPHSPQLHSRQSVHVPPGFITLQVGSFAEGTAAVSPLAHRIDIVNMAWQF